MPLEEKDLIEIIDEGLKDSIKDIWTSQLFYVVMELELN